MCKEEVVLNYLLGKLRFGRSKPQPFDKLKKQNDDKKSPHNYISD